MLSRIPTTRAAYDLLLPSAVVPPTYYDPLLPRHLRVRLLASLMLRPVHPHRVWTVYPRAAPNTMTPVTTMMRQGWWKKMVMVRRTIGRCHQLLSHLHLLGFRLLISLLHLLL